MLDLEERFGATNAPAMEPAVQRLAGQIVRHTQSAPLSPRVAQVALLGTAPRWFEMFGVRYEKAASLPTNAGVVLIGPDASMTKRHLTLTCKTAARSSFCRARTRVLRWV
jgi:hypothetical protein